MKETIRIWKSDPVFWGVLLTVLSISGMSLAAFSAKDIFFTHFLFEFRMSVPDPYLIFFVTAGIFCFYAYAQERKLKWLFFSAVSAALATLAKGPVALALPAMVLVWWVLSQKKYGLLFSWKMLLYVAVIVLVAAPWYLIIHLKTNGEFTRQFFFEHNFNRFGEPMEGHGGLFIMVPLFVLLGLLPVSVFSGELAKKLRSYHRNTFVRLCMYVTVVFIVFFSLSGTKLPIASIAYATSWLASR